MKKILFSAIVIFILSISTAKSQYTFELAAGLRVGYPYGITGKMFFSERDAIEGIAHFYFGRGLGITGLYEYHLDLVESPDFNIYFGGGLSVTAFNGSFFNTTPYTALGVDAIVGVEHTFDDFPLNVSLDVKPTLYLFGSSSLRPFLPAAGMSVRYIFK